MSRETIQWLLGVGLFVVFLVLMLRGCGGVGGCCGMGQPRKPGHRREEDAGQSPHHMQGEKP